MTKKRKSVVVTGLGLATALGLDVEENWQRVLAGTSGISRLAGCSVAKSPVQGVGEIKGPEWKRLQEEFSEVVPVEHEKRTLFALWAAQHALKDAGVTNTGAERGRYGVILAAGLGINRLEDIQRWIDTGIHINCS